MFFFSVIIGMQSKFYIDHIQGRLVRETNETRSGHKSRSHSRNVFRRFGSNLLSLAAPSNGLLDVFQVASLRANELDKLCTVIHASKVASATPLTNMNATVRCSRIFLFSFLSCILYLAHDLLQIL